MHANRANVLARIRRGSVVALTLLLLLVGQSSTALAAWNAGVGVVSVSPYAPPDNTHTIPYTYQGMVYYIDKNTLTATGATVEDTALDPNFHPAAEGVSYGPTKTVPNCVSAPQQGGPVDRATYTDEQLATYGLPTWADWTGRGNTDRAEWERSVRNSGTRLCQYSSLYEDGQLVTAGNATIGAGHLGKVSTLPAMPAKVRMPNISYCLNFLPVAQYHWWGWQSDSTGSFNGGGCPESSYYPYTAMEGYLDVPHWDNLASGTQNTAGWLGRGGWNVSGCLGYDVNSLIQTGFIETTVGFVNLVHQAFWENTGWGASCGAQAISGWSPNGGDELYIILGCGGYTDCNYVHIEDQTQGGSNHYFTNYVSGPSADMHSASCMYELTQSHLTNPNNPFDILYYNPTNIWFCRATHEIPSLNLTIEEGVGNYNASTIVTTQPLASNWCAWSDMPSNPDDLTWPNSTLPMKRDNTNNHCNMYG